MNRKAIWSVVIAIVMAFSCVAFAEETAYLAGEYVGEASGFGGTVKVCVTVSDSEVTDIVVEAENETPEIGGKALATLQEQLLEAGAAEIDGVSGATVTSSAVKEAAAMAFALAKGEAVEKAEVKVPDGVVLGENEYYGEDANGANGLISVKVTLEDGVIKAIKVLEQHETRGLGTTAILKMSDAMIKGNTTEVDLVAGATLSSNAFKRAVVQAVESAK